MRAQGGADIGERQLSQIADRCCRSGDEDRHLLAGVVAARPGRVVAVVGGEDCQVARAQRVQELRQTVVERFQLGSIAGYIAPVPPQLVEIDEVDDDQ